MCSKVKRSTFKNGADHILDKMHENIMQIREPNTTEYSILADWVTVVDTLATSYLPSTSASAGSAAENAAQRKELKYSALTSSYDFIPLAFETLGPINDSAICFLSALGQRTSAVTHDSRETSFLYQRLSILVQRFNAVCFRNTFYSTSSDLDD